MYCAASFLTLSPEFCCLILEMLVKHRLHFMDDLVLALFLAILVLQIVVSLQKLKLSWQMYGTSLASPDCHCAFSASSSGSVSTCSGSEHGTSCSAVLSKYSCCVHLG